MDVRVDVQRRSLDPPVLADAHGGRREHPGHQGRLGVALVEERSDLPERQRAVG